MRLRSLLLLALLALAGRALADEASAPPDFAKMRVKQLQAVLSERGVSSAGIAEKAELAKLAAESWSLPVLEVEAPKVEEAAAQAQEDKPPKSKEDIEKVLRNLKLNMPGGGKGFQVFGQQDMAELRKRMEKGGKGALFEEMAADAAASAPADTKEDL